MSEDDRTLFVGGMSERVTEELLYELFLQVGPLEKVVIPKDKEGRPRRFGFITFQHDVSVQFAKQAMEGIQLFGKTLSLQNRGSNESPRSSPRSSPHYNSDPQQISCLPSFNRSNTWHGNESSYQGQSPKFDGQRSGQSPQYDFPTPYAQGKSYTSVDVLRGHSSSGNLYQQSSMQPREQAPLDIRRQRILDQQQMSINMQSHRNRDIQNERYDKHSYHDKDNHGRNYQPYNNNRDRRRR